MAAHSQTPLPAAQGADDRAGRDEHFLLELGELLRLTGSSSQLLFDVATRLAEYLGASRCLFSEIDRDRDRATVHRDYHRGLPSLAGSLPLTAYSQENLAALRAGRVVVVADTAVDPRTSAQFERDYRAIGVRASVAVPLFLQGRWISTLYVSSHQPRVWQGREVALIQLVAERTWMTVEHLRAVDALRQSEARSAALLASAFDAILSMDHRGRIVEFNQAAQKLFGMSREEALGRSVVELVVLPGWARLDTGPSFPFSADGSGPLVGKLIQVPAVRADGASFPAEIAIAAVHGVSPPLFTATLRDVTQRVRSAEQFRHAVDVSPTGMIMVDGEGCIALVNAPIERLFGYERGELAGRPVELLLPAADGEPAGDRRERMGLRKDGSPVTVQVELTPMPSSEGAFTLASIADVTERRRLEAEREELVSELRELSRGLEERIAERTQELAVAHRTLTRSEANFRAVIENAPDAILVHRWGPIVYVNPAFSRALGYLDREELIGWSIIELVHLDDRDRVRGRIRDLREKGGAERHQVRMLHADGSERWMEAAGVPIEFDGGAAVLMMCRDVTESLSRHKEAEDQIRSSLREKEVLLKEVHRVKNNLQVISSLLNLQAQHLSDPVARAVLAESQARVRSIAMVHEKLYRSQDLAHVRFDEYVRELVADRFHSLDIGSRAITSCIEVEDVNLAVTTAIPCGLIVNELVTNSLKHGFPADRAGSIRIALRSRGDGRLELVVEDDGVGLPTDLDPLRSSSLGLELVTMFAEQIEAVIEVRRSEGTSFSFVFPPPGGPA